jgi:hypothetical protein
VPRLVAREQPQPRPKTDAAISMTSTCGEMLSAIPHQWQPKLCNSECALTPLNCIGKQQNGHRGFETSLSMRPLVGRGRLTESKHGYRAYSFSVSR